MAPFHLPRRSFLRSCAVLTAGAALPAWYPAEARKVATRIPWGPNDRPKVALIGCGGMGRYDAKLASAFGDVVALCDVDAERLDQAGADYPKARKFRDFRECLSAGGADVVINGTPDHWHTLINLAAVHAGKDVYSEKPLTLTIEEGQRLVKAVRATGAVLQTGSQQRSDSRFRLAVELVRNGRIGRLKHVTTSLPSGPHGGPFSPSPVPPSLDWDVWQGQTPAVPYVKQRCHGTFRYWWDYSAGTLTDWGAHHNDIALWGLGESGPVAVEGHAMKDPVPGGFSFPSTYFVHFRYASGVTHTCRTVETEGGGGNVLNPNTPPAQMSNGVLFEGSNGWIFVTRGKIAASDPAILQEPLSNRTWTAEVSDNHMGNFFDGVRSRKRPICDVEVGHRSVSVCHLGAIAIRLGRRLQWDPAAERFVGDREANRWVARDQRKGYTYASVS